MVTRLLFEQIRSPLWGMEEKKRYLVQELELTPVQKCSAVSHRR